MQDLARAAADTRNFGRAGGKTSNFLADRTKAMLPYLRSDIDAVTLMISLYLTSVVVTSN
jgi:hypothetical protein